MNKHDEPQSEQDDDNNSDILTERSENKDRNSKHESTNRNNSNGRSNNNKSSGKRQQCQDCSRYITVKKKGGLHKHKCVGGKESADNDEPNSQNAKNRARARVNAAEKRRAQGRQPRQTGDERDENEEIGDNNDNANRDDARTVTQRNNNERRTGRVARRRQNKQNNWIEEHRNRLAQAAREGTSNEEFTQDLGALLTHTPPGHKSTPTTDNIEEHLNRQKEQWQEDLEEEERMWDLPAEATNTNSSAGRERAVQEQILKKVKMYIREGDLKKARQAMTTDNGLYNITTTQGSALLKSKFKKDDVRQREGEQFRHSEKNNEMAELTSTGGLTDETACKTLQAYIDTRKNRASPSATGISNDNYKKITRKYPKTIEYVVTICDRIAGGSVIDSPVLDTLLRGKGTALTKGIANLRPINTGQPLLNYTGVLLNKLLMDKIIEVTGDQQLAMRKAGVEANGHFLRYCAEKDSNTIIGTIDLKDAYQTPYHHLIVQSVEKHVPQMLPYTSMLMEKTIPQIIFHDRKTQATQVTTMERGVTQGGTASTAQFCIALHEHVTKEVIEEFKDVAKFSFISDNISISSDPHTYMDIFLTFKDRIEAMGGAVNASMSTIWGMGQYTEQQKQRAETLGIRWIDSNEGNIIAGTIIGSKEYTENEVGKKVDDILEEVDRMRQLVKSPNRGMGNIVQSMIHLISRCSVQQFVFTMRTTPPDFVQNQAERLEIGIANAYLDITDSIKFLPPQHSEKMQKVVDQLFLPASMGGMGLMSAKDIYKAAYTGSMLQCLPLMNKLDPDIAEMAETQDYTPSIAKLIDCINEFKEQEIDAVKDIDVRSPTIFTQTTTGIQKKISAHLMRAKQQQFERTSPTGETINGIPAPPSEIVERLQRDANTDSSANAWMFANPAHYANSMSNADFCDAINTRLCLRLMGNHEFCRCGDEIDGLGMHMNNCRLQQVSSAHRNDLHSKIKHTTIKTLTVGTAKNSRHTVDGSGEPAIDRFLEPKDDNDTDNRSDIAIDSSAAGGGVLIIDVTTSSPLIPETLRQVANGTYKPGDGAKHGESRKHKHYNSRFHLDRVRVPHPVELKTICLETTGPIGPESERVLKRIAAILAEQQEGDNNDNGDGQNTPTHAEIAMQLRYLKQKYSVSLQSWRARWMRKFRTCHTLPTRPPIPQEPGDGRLPILAPPLYVGLPDNHRRTNAVTPLPPRAPPGIARRTPPAQ